MARPLRDSRAGRVCREHQLSRDAQLREARVPQLPDVSALVWSTKGQGGKTGILTSELLGLLRAKNLAEAKFGRVDSAHLFRGSDLRTSFRFLPSLERGQSESRD